MLTIEKVDTNNKPQVKRFVQFYYDLYKDCPEWVPPLFGDAYLPLNRKKHPFFEHSEADFFLAVDDGKVVGRICAAENKPFNKYHQTRKAQFYAFDAINDLEIARALFDAAFDWSRARGLDTMIGPKGLSPFDGYGIQIEGFEHRQMMTMMNYNFAYYPTLLEALGFEKEVDFVSCYLPAESFRVPERVERIANRAAARAPTSRSSTSRARASCSNGLRVSERPTTAPSFTTGNTIHLPPATCSTPLTMFSWSPTIASSRLCCTATTSWVSSLPSRMSPLLFSVPKAIYSRLG